MEPSFSQSEALGVVDIALLCCQSDARKTPQTTEEKWNVQFYCNEAAEQKNTD